MSGDMYLHKVTAKLLITQPSTNHFDHCAPVLVPGPRDRPDGLVDLLERRRGLERPQELDGLAGGQQLDGNHLLDVAHNLITRTLILAFS